MVHDSMRWKRLKQRFVVAGMLALLGMSFSTPLRAEEAAEKKAAELLKKYVEVTGGEAAFGKIKNRVAEMTVTMPVADMKMKLKAYSAKPNKSYLVVEAEGFGRMEQGCDGEVVWEKSDLTGCRIKSGKERSMAMREATLDRFVQWKNVYDKAEYAGMEEVDGKPCHKIVMTPKADDEGEQDPETIYIDKETNLISKITAKMEMAGSPVPVALIVSDYKDVDGIKLSHKMIVVVAGQEQVMTIDSVKNNVDIPGDQFDLPKEVKELIKDEE